MKAELDVRVEEPLHLALFNLSTPTAVLYRTLFTLALTVTYFEDEYAE